MKKNAKIRLTLNRETLRNLGAEETSGAQGGVVVQQITQSCFETYCVCVSQTCPTRCGQTYCYYV